VPEEPGLADVIGEQRELLSRLRAVVEAKDAENQVLRAELDAARERERRLGLRLAELERDPDRSRFAEAVQIGDIAPHVSGRPPPSVT
jgi:hypothetical protein